MHEQCVPGSFSFSLAQEPGNEATKYVEHILWQVPFDLTYIYLGNVEHCGMGVSDAEIHGLACVIAVWYIN